jgi:hypothetical protein
LRNPDTILRTRLNSIKDGSGGGICVLFDHLVRV